MERKESIGEDATSKETLQDLEENEATMTESDEESLPSPDGQLDDPDQLEDADPA